MIIITATARTPFTRSISARKESI
uniref:Uncharacterized protein n=1 Tax=Anguilla anguilla TaxID=7936 RepID=A0A0E9P5J2_ANGAN